MDLVTVAGSTYNNDDQPKLILMVVLVLIDLYLILSSALFWRARHYDLVAKRLPSVVMVCTLLQAILMNMFYLNLRIANFWTFLPCVVQGITYSLMMVQYFIGFSIRFSHLAYTFALQQARLAAGGVSRTSAVSEEGPPAWLIKMVFRLFSFLSSSKKKDGQDLTQFSTLTAATVLKALAYGLVGCGTLMIVYLFAVTSTTDLYTQGICPKISYGAMYLILFIFIVIATTILLSIRHIQDGVGLRHELVLSFVPAYPAVVLYMLQGVADIPIFPDPISATFTPTLALLFAHIMTVQYPLVLLSRAERERNNLKMDHSSFDRMLGDAELFQELKVSAAQELCIENALFCEDYWQMQDLGGVHRTGITKQLLTANGASTSIKSKTYMSTHHSGASTNHPITNGQGSVRRGASVLNAKVANVGLDKRPNNIMPVIQDEKTSNAANSMLAITSNQGISGMALAVATDGKSHGEAMQALGQALYEKFLAPNAQYELNIPSKTLVDVRKAMQEGNAGNTETFEPIYQAVLYMLFTNTYPRYLKNRKAIKSLTSGAGTVSSTNPSQRQQSMV